MHLGNRIERMLLVTEKMYSHFTSQNPSSDLSSEEYRIVIIQAFQKELISVFEEAESEKKKSRIS